MKEAVRQHALALGFDDCRFTTARAPASAPQLSRWLDAGWHGEMEYLRRNAFKRVDPEQVLSGIETIITLAASYFHADSKGNEGETPSGIVARYARHNDYHDLLAAPLKVLSGFVNGLGGENAKSLWYVDTGPLLERDLAQRSGLGFVGKHTNLISRKLGNWIFLSEILTTVEFPPDESETNHCGKCSRCIAACPTNAIRAPFQLDARRCISYLTIELKGSIPIELRPLIGTRIFGCDDCLAICPWNRFAREGKLMSSARRSELEFPALLDLLGLDDQGFRQRFAQTPVQRIKRRGLLRNVCVALGNVKNRAALPLLEKAALDREPLVAEHARWAIQQITGL